MKRTLKATGVAIIILAAVVAAMWSNGRLTIPAQKSAPTSVVSTATPIAVVPTATPIAVVPTATPIAVVPTATPVATLTATPSDAEAAVLTSKEVSMAAIGGNADEGYFVRAVRQDAVVGVERIPYEGREFALPTTPYGVAVKWLNSQSALDWLESQEYPFPEKLFSGKGLLRADNARRGKVKNVLEYAIDRELQYVDLDGEVYLVVENGTTAGGGGSKPTATPTPTPTATPEPTPTATPEPTPTATPESTKKPTATPNGHHRER